MKKGAIHPTKLLIKEIEKKEQVLKSGIIAPRQVLKNDTLSGVVVLTGEKCEFVKEGMVVLYPRMSAIKFDLENQELGLLSEGAVLFAYNPEAK